MRDTIILIIKSIHFPFPVLRLTKTITSNLHKCYIVEWLKSHLFAVMPDACVVPGCVPPKKNALFDSARPLAYHHFPTDSVVRKKWLDNLGWEKVPYDQALVCSRHFTDECYKKQNLKGEKLKMKVLYPGKSIYSRVLNNSFEKTI